MKEAVYFGFSTTPRKQLDPGHDRKSSDRKSSTRFPSFRSFFSALDLSGLRDLGILG